MRCSVQLSRGTPQQLYQLQINSARADVMEKFQPMKFFESPRSMDCTVRKNDLQQYIFPVDKFMYSFINKGNSNRYLFRLIHSPWMLRTLNNNIYHVLFLNNNACCSGITTDFYLVHQKIR